jgi:hypothetical protein
VLTNPISDTGSFHYFGYEPEPSKRIADTLTSNSAREFRHMERTQCTLLLQPNTIGAGPLVVDSHLTTRFDRYRRSNEGHYSGLHSPPGQ